MEVKNKEARIIKLIPRKTTKPRLIEGDCKVINMQDWLNNKKL